MLTHVISKEYADLCRESRLRWALYVTYLLFFIALFSGYRYYSLTHAQRQKAQQTSYQQWLDQGKKNPHSAAHYGLYVYKPVPLLSVLDKGMDDYLGSSLWLEAHRQNAVRNRTIGDSADLSRFGSLTVGFVWQYLLPLVIILLTFNLVSGEKELGTLRMVLSTDTSATTLILGKGVAVLRIIGGWFLLPMLVVSTGVMMLAGEGAAFGEAWPGLVCWVAFYSVFLAIFITLGLIVSTRASSSGLSLAILLGIWVFGAFFVPRLSGSLAQAWYPVPSAFAFNQRITFEKANGINAHDPANQFNQQLLARTLKQYGVDSVSQLPVSFAAISLQAGEDRDWHIFDKHYGQLFRAFGQQQAVMDVCNLLSPILTMRNLARALAGTDEDQHRAFTTQAEHFRRDIMKTMNTDMKQYGAGKDYDYLASEKLWGQVKPFSFRPPGLAQALRHQLIGLGSLLLWLIASGGALLYSARRLTP